MRSPLVLAVIVIALVVVAAAGCGARTPVSQSGLSVACEGFAPQCIGRPADGDDPCGLRTVTRGTCDEATHAWSCPRGTKRYASTTPPATCLPMIEAGVSTVGEWGLSSIVRVPTDDGRCLWIAEDVKFSDGTEKRNVAFEPDLDAPFGTCPTKSRSTPVPIVTLEDGDDDPSILVQLTGGWRLAGKTRVAYRIFRLDSSSAFGVTLVGGGLARWDTKSERIVVPSPSKKPFPWGNDLDLGDASVLSPKGDRALVWGCTKTKTKGTPDLVEGCTLAEIDANDSVTVRSEPQFGSGPWVSSVVANGPSRWDHVYIAGFGSTLERDTASDPIGPWTQSSSIARCQLPSGDPKAFCAGPVVHPEIADPTHAGELPITYSIGSTGPHVTTTPLAYWPRLVLVR